MAPPPQSRKIRRSLALQPGGREIEYIFHTDGEML